ncbi:hypothetical protein D1AOALGA4SA_5942 [Olavius algarvensis Delta 1 endosymbiont]|nr:hypothetical protein D1AOALGA4SA_5942 [Olavius algarvensis Delta 1 endosymbiont]
MLEHSNIIPGTYIAACHHPIFPSIRVIPDHEFVRKSSIFMSKLWSFVKLVQLFSFLDGFFEFFTNKYL